MLVCLAATRETTNATSATTVTTMIAVGQPMNSPATKMNAIATDEPTAQSRNIRS